MARRVVPLTGDLLAALDGHCRDCVTWEMDPVSRHQIAAEARGQAKAEVIARIQAEWGQCGQVVLVEDRPVGLVTYGPPAYFPGSADCPTAPISPDAIQLASLWVEPDSRGGGLGRLLIHRMARDVLHRGGTRAVEVFATADGTPGRCPCAIPEGFATRVGFGPHRDHPQTPRLRMDLRTALTWRDEVEGAATRIAQIARAIRPPQTAVPQHRDGSRPGAQAVKPC